VTAIAAGVAALAASQRGEPKKNPGWVRPGKRNDVGDKPLARDDCVACAVWTARNGISVRNQRHQRDGQQRVDGELEGLRGPDLGGHVSAPVRMSVTSTQSS
jgi:hypothetical protein